MTYDRRTFLQNAALLTGATLVTGSLSADTAKPTSAAGVDLIARMSWLNPPASVSKSDGAILAHSAPKSDFWREPPDDFRDTGHFFHLPVSGDFAFQARFNGGYNGQYDHAGLMVRVDAENWVKCGCEFYDGLRHASVVFTRGFSDWSTMADPSQSAPVWWRVMHKKNWVTAQYSADGKTFTTVREGYFVSAAKIDVGIMCATPKDNGFDVTFDNLKLEVI
jgi:regulation of enolase protein 1 (concanavalin A-like superfamily)